MIKLIILSLFTLVYPNNLEKLENLLEKPNTNTKDHALPIFRTLVEQEFSATPPTAKEFESLSNIMHMLLKHPSISVKLRRTDVENLLKLYDKSTFVKRQKLFLSLVNTLIDTYSKGENENRGLNENLLGHFLRETLYYEYLDESRVLQKMYKKRFVTKGSSSNDQFNAYTARLDRIHARFKQSDSSINKLLKKNVECYYMFEKFNISYDQSQYQQLIKDIDKYSTRQKCANVPQYVKALAYIRLGKVKEGRGLLEKLKKNSNIEISNRIIYGELLAAHKSGENSKALNYAKKLMSQRVRGLQPFQLEWGLTAMQVAIKSKNKELFQLTMREMDQVINKYVKVDRYSDLILAWKKIGEHVVLNKRYNEKKVRSLLMSSQKYLGNSFPFVMDAKTLMKNMSKS